MSAMSNYNQVYIITKDANGRLGCNFIPCQNVTPYTYSALDDLVDAYQACVDTAVIAAQFVQTKQFSNTHQPGPYNTFFDRGTLLTRFQDTTSGHIDLVGPKESIFNPDHQFIDFSNTNIMNLLVKLLALVQSPSGSLLASVPKGTRTKVNPYPPGG
jgi:hypothetical protein